MSPAGLRALNTRSNRAPGTTSGQMREIVEPACTIASEGSTATWNGNEASNAFGGRETGGVDDLAALMTGQ
jgi:hypothetical protein